MSLEAIRRKIAGDAREEAERMVSEAEQEKKVALDEKRAQLSDRAEKDRARLGESLKQRKSRLREHVLKEAERKLLNQRRSLIDEAIRKAVHSLPDSEDYTGIVSAVLGRCDFTGEVEVIISGADRERFDQAFLDSHSTDKVKFKLSEENHDAPGGVILRSGRVSQNATLQMMASLVHEDLVMELSRSLSLQKRENQ